MPGMRRPCKGTTDRRVLPDRRKEDLGAIVIKTPQGEIIEERTVIWTDKKGVVFSTIPEDRRKADRRTGDSKIPKT